MDAKVSILLGMCDNYFTGVTLIKPEDLEFPNTMTDIEYDTWMLRLVLCLECVTMIHQTFVTTTQVFNK